jgi:signal transduction histidine kinase
LQAAYDSERQQDRISLLEYEREKLQADELSQRRMLIGVLSGLGFAILCAILLFRYYRRQQRINLILEGLHREKDGLISIVAHDLKAPLNKTKMLVELLKTSTEISDEQSKLLTMIDKVATDGGLLIQDLLEITLLADEKRDEEKQTLDLVQLAVGMVEAYAPNATKKKLQVVQSHSEAAIELHTNRQPLERILDNLLSNAIKFSPSGRSIYISTKKDQGFAYFSIRDEGPGISPEDQKKMFGKFQKLSARPTAGESSNGLGLSIVKALVDRLHGEIEVKSTLGVGTEFVVKMPINGVPM